MTKSSNKQFQYNQESRAKRVIDNETDTITEFEYDVFGRRVYKKVIQGDDISEFWYTANDFISSSIRGERRDMGYIFLNGYRIAEQGSSDQLNDTRFYHFDILGSNKIVTNKDGVIIEEIEYSSFGQFIDDTNPAVSFFKFTGQEFDRSTILYNYNSRLYDPAIGRFISADFITPAVLNVQLLNKYSYVLNNPFKYIDPTGHLPVWIQKAAYVAVNVIIGAVEGFLIGAAVGNAPGAIIGAISGGGCYLVSRQQSPFTRNLAHSLIELQVNLI